MIVNLLADISETEEASIGPGLTAFLIVLALGVATFFLVRSMLHQIKKVPPTFDEPDPDGRPIEQDGHDESGRSDSAQGQAHR